MKRKNKIILTVAYALSGILIALVVSLSLIKTNYAPNVNEPMIINFQYGAESNKGITGSKENSKDDYDKYLNAYKNAFRESVMSGFFSGRTGFESYITSYDGTSTNKDPMKTLSGYIAKFTFGEDQTLKLNGKDYHPNTDTTKTVVYKEMFFEISENDSMKSHKIYFKSDDGTTVKYYVQTVMCNFSNLYKIIDEKIGE